MGSVDRVIVWTEPAKNDIKEVTIYWNHRNKSNIYSLKLRKIIRQKLSLIAKFPTLGIQTDYRTARCFVIKDYKLFYEVTEDAIVVLRFWDTHQNPDTLEI